MVREWQKNAFNLFMFHADRMGLLIANLHEIYKLR
jgi:hypothetical protein